MGAFRGLIKTVRGARHVGPLVSIVVTAAALLPAHAGAADFDGAISARDLLRVAFESRGASPSAGEQVEAAFPGRHASATSPFTTEPKSAAAVKTLHELAEQLRSDALRRRRGGAPNELRELPLFWASLDLAYTIRLVQTARAAVREIQAHIERRIAEMSALPNTEARLREIEPIREKLRGASVQLDGLKAILDGRLATFSPIDPEPAGTIATRVSQEMASIREGLRWAVTAATATLSESTAGS